MKKKAFTLIELIAVLVILAILALIVTPLVMSIIKKARISADRRSIDAYGRSVELAIANYLLDSGDFPTDISDLTIEYSGDRVECETTQINPDSSIYLAGCTVAGRSVDYTYGSDKTPSYEAYEIGDEVTYNGINYYVIKDSGTKEQAVTLLKAEPLTVAEVNQYGGVGTVDNHVNRYTSESQGTAYDKNGYGGMAYYTSETCGSVNLDRVIDGCTTDYAQSEVKYVVDSWKTTNAPQATEARLITYEELISELECTSDNCSNSSYNWLYNSNYDYWTSTSSSYDPTTSMRFVETNGGLYFNGVNFNIGGWGGDSVVRPVIVLPKSALE